MNRTSVATRPLNWLANPLQAIVGRGGQIVWSKVSNFFDRGKFTVKLGAAALKAAVSLTVDPLPQPLRKGEVLDFGTEASVVVTFSAASVDATTVGVTALTGPIPSGAILKTADAKEFVKLTAPAIATDTSLTIEALDNALEGGETATYQGGKKLAEVSADAAAGATTVSVAAIPFAIADDSEAIMDTTGKVDGRMIPSGTVMVRDSSDKLFPRRDVTGAETASELLTSDAFEFSKSAAKSGYGTYIAAQVFENLLPDADTDGNISGTYKTELTANGARFNFSDLTDSRFTD